MTLKNDPHPVKSAKAHEPTPTEELYRTLHAIVLVAERSGGRDDPEVVAAREMLQKHEKLHGQ